MKGLFHAEIGRTRGEHEPIQFTRILSDVTKREAAEAMVLAQRGTHAHITRDGFVYRMIPRVR